LMMRMRMPREESLEVDQEAARKKTPLMMPLMMPREESLEVDPKT